jgi:hypothetical protein
MTQIITFITSTFLVVVHAPLSYIFNADVSVQQASFRPQTLATLQCHGGLQWQLRTAGSVNTDPETGYKSLEVNPDFYLLQSDSVIFATQNSRFNYNSSYVEPTDPEYNNFRSLPYVLKMMTDAAPVDASNKVIAFQCLQDNYSTISNLVFVENDYSWGSFLLKSTHPNYSDSCDNGSC